MEIQPIGKILSPYKELFGTPRQGLLVPQNRGYIELNTDIAPESLDGLIGFSHIWVLFHFHKNKSKTLKFKVHPPRAGGDSFGVFATRSPHRPNPIGMSVLRLLGIEGRKLAVAGLDLVDGTPVLDIKPYVKDYDSHPDATRGWLDQIESSNLMVEFEEAARTTLEKEAKRFPDCNLFEVIAGTLKNDPRPIVYKENPEHKDSHAMYFEDLDVHFKFTKSGIKVTEIKRLQK
jgi:tRNA-Thr(GGU) m(6)t(6)A37 methyltransferase TsaA